MTEPLLLPELLGSTVSTFAVISLAEIGDKSQMVCMTLASKHRHPPVLWGAMTAFALLNLLAVLFGAAVAAWLPAWLIATSVGTLFLFFGIHNLRQGKEEDEEEITERPGHSVFATTFLMIFLAEFGDKTQIAVAGLSSTQALLPVWLGATLALTVTSALGVFAGSQLLKKIPLYWIHKISGGFFIALSLVAFSQLIQLFA